MLLLGLCVLDPLIRGLAIIDAFVPRDDYSLRASRDTETAHACCQALSSTFSSTDIFHVRIIPSTSLTAFSADPFD